MSETPPSRVASGRNARLLDAVMIGLPDAITSAWCLWVWMYPMALGAEAVKCVVLMMWMEFILLNATGFFTAIPFMFGVGRAVRTGLTLLIGAIYLSLIVGFANQFQATWPYFVFGWLAAAKLMWIARNRRVTSSEQMWLTGTWAVSVVAYLGAVGISETQPLPHFGIVPALVPSLHVPSGGEWAHSPHEAVASAVFYFAAVALFKWLYVAVRKNQPVRGQGADPDSDPAESFDAAT